MNSPLLQPIRIGALELPNRILMPAMHLNLTPEGRVTDALVDFYVARARGGVGLMVIGACTVNPLAGAPFMLRVQDDSDLPGLTRLARAIREAGGRAALQLYHGGAYVHSLLLGGEPAVSASEVVSGLTGEMPRALTADEVEALVWDFAAAAERTRAAGFDAVEVCGSAGYIVSQFLAPRTNRRDDDYGGDEARRMRFGLDVARAIRRRVGPDFPLLYRLAGNPFVAEGGGSGLAARFAAALEAASVQAFNVTGGWHETRVPQLTSGVPTGAYSYLARIVRERVTVPVVACNRVTTPEAAEAVLASGHADLIGLGRALIADPEFPRKVAEGRRGDLVHCIACNQGCFDAVFDLVPCRCMTNPLSGKEALVKDARPVTKPQRVVVIGAGPAGLAAAWAAAWRGHRVTVLERAEGPGGQLHLAGRRADRRGFLQLISDLTQRAILAGAEIRYGMTADEAMLRGLGSDLVLVATGARPAGLDVPGADGPNVVSSWEALAEPNLPGDRVVVVGGGATGCEVALHLAARGVLDAETVRFLLVSGAEPPEEIVRLATRGTRQVTIVELGPRVGADIGRSTRWVVLGELKAVGVEVRPKTRLLAVEAGGARVAREDGTTELLACDKVVLATGVVPETDLAARLEAAGFAVTRIGDAARPRKALDAIHEGFDAGWAIPATP